MNNKQKIKNDESDEMHETFVQYAFEIIADIVLGICLGLVVNVCADYIGNIFNLPLSAKITVQLFLIVVVLYLMKIDSRYLYASWKGHTGYGIIFMTVFMAVQNNMIKLFDRLEKYVDILQKNINTNF